MTDIKKIAKEKKAENGNAKLTKDEKDWYIIARLDHIVDELNASNIQIAKNKFALKLLFVILTGFILKVVVF